MYAKPVRVAASLVHIAGLLGRASAATAAPPKKCMRGRIFGVWDELQFADVLGVDEYLTKTQVTVIAAQPPSIREFPNSAH